MPRLVNPGARTVWTFEDYMQLPDDGRRYEIIEGELYELDAPNWDHQEVAGRIYALLLEYADRTGNGRAGIAPIDVVLSNIAVVQPDVIYVSRERLGIVRGKVHGAPDLAVEVLSPSNRSYDRKLKFDSYRKNGVPWYWIVDPEARTLEVVHCTDAGYVASGRFEGDAIMQAPFPEGFVLPLARIWPRPLR